MCWWILILLPLLFTITDGEAAGKQCMYITHLGITADSGEKCANTSVCNKTFNVTLLNYEPYSTFNFMREFVDECCGKCTQISFSNTIPHLTNLTTHFKTAHFIYPVLARSTANRIYGYHFIPFLEAPSAVYITKKNERVLEELILTCLRLYPLIIICLLMAVISGFITWLLETWSNIEQFPRAFFRGWFEGLWWSFVTMTTVGYGDKTPITRAGRVFSFIWIMIGIIAFDMLTGTLTAEIDHAIHPKPPSMAGANVGVLKQRTYDAMMVAKHGGILVTAEPEDFIEEVYELIRMLNDNKIDGFLIDIHTWKILDLMGEHKEFDKFNNSNAGDYQEFFKNSYYTEYSLTGEKYSYGILVKFQEDYDYFRDAIVDNSVVMETSISLTWNKYGKRPSFRHVDIFSTSEPYFWDSLKYISIIFGVILFFGIASELYRIKTCKKKNSVGLN